MKCRTCHFCTCSIWTLTIHVTWAILIAPSRTWQIQHFLSYPFSILSLVQSKRKFALSTDVSEYSMSIWVNSWCEFFTFPLTQLFPLGWKSWLIYQIIVGNLVFHQIIVSINFFIVTQIKFFWYLLFQTQIKFFIGKIVSIAKTFEPFNIPIELGVDFTSDELLTSISTNHFVLIQFIFDKRR